MAPNGRFVALAGAAATAGVFALPEGAPRNIAYDVAASLCIVVMAVAIRAHRPPHRVSWWLVVLGNALLVLGDIAYSVLEALGESGAPCPADIFYLAAYPALGAGLYLTARGRGRQRAAIVDGLIFSIVSTTAAWTYLIAPNFDTANLPGLADAVVISYPVMDIAILVIALRLALGGGWRLLVQQYATVALGLLLAADTAYTVMALEDSYVLGSIVDGAWLLSYVAWAAAACHPSMRKAADPMTTSRTLARSHVGLLLVGAIAMPAIAFDRGFDHAAEALVLFQATIIVTVLCMLRLASVTALLRRTVVDESTRATNMEMRLAALIRHSADVIMVIDRLGAIQYVSPSIEPNLGWTESELMALPPFALIHPEDRALVEGERAWDPSRESRYTSPKAVALRWRHGNGEWRHVEVIATDLLADPAVEGLVLNIRDITDRKALQDELAHQAFHDSLTGLPNRLLFADRVQHALRQRQDPQHPSRVAVLFCDLDDFKTINDTFGHAEGDRVLRSVAGRLVTAIRPGDTAARLGGDEFAILVEGIDDDAAIDRIAARVLAAITGRHMIEGRPVYLSGSVGVAAAPVGSTTGDALMRDADVAMYAAKREGKNQWTWFDLAMHTEVMERLRFESELRVALEEDQFEVHYQPIVKLDGGTIVGAEALVRWRHPERGLVPPGSFIPLAEETGVIVPLGWWVLETACGFAATQRRAHDPAFSISVNLSALQLAEFNLVDKVAAALRGAGLHPSALVLELTESAIVSDSTAVIDRLHELKALGVRIAIDDFGTGYSSLSYLQRLPVDVLKIDKSFVDHVGASDADLVPAIIDVARTLGLATVAEGVELAEQAGRLSALGCERAQGYLFARPLPPEEFVRQCIQSARTSWTMSSSPAPG